MLAIWSLSSTFSKPSCTSKSSQFIYCWSRARRILSINLLACEMSAIVWQFEHSLALPLFGIGMKTDLFPALWPLLSFLNLVAYRAQQYNSIIFYIFKYLSWNSITSIAFSIVMLLKAHLTSHSRMSGPRWMTAPSWISRPLKPFLYSSSVFSCHLFLIFSASISSYLEEISSFYHSTILLYFFALFS